MIPSLALASLVSSSAQQRKSVPGVIHAPLSAHSEDKIASAWEKWRKRQTSEVDITNQQTGTAYTIDIGLGTPSQQITVLVDTGSVNLWVNPECDTSGQQEWCEGFSQFDYTSTSTIQDTGLQEELSYGKGDVVVEYVTDTVTIGSTSIEAQQFGIGIESTDIAVGILGLSPPIDGYPEYDYVLDSMVIQSLIASRAFSLDLRDVDSPDGALILGGVDTGKYIGSLEKCPILDGSQTTSGADRYWITLTSIGMTAPNGNSGLLASGALAVFLDSGGTLTRLPTSVFEDIGDAFAGFGAQYDESSGFYIIDCDTMNQSGSVDFGFNDKVISITFENFIWHSPDSETCFLGVLADDDEPVLGDSFLRAAYVVYDQDNANLHLAQAANCGTNLVAISSGTDAVPSVTGDCTGSSATVATAAFSYVSTAPTVTTDVESVTSVVDPGPQGTNGATSSATLCLTCTKTTSTGSATSKPTVKAAAAERQIPFAAVVGIAALAAWLM
ncbi:hypothetical protein N0V93_004473 [Gnomoniopsis smithogilvyi]|uniref:Peptidase A1 domain-containing protein n=1 Tax=Gnomoniopsis smithogilvyi TaxID=1191159 RepID=A0A9W9CX66_9PEZI|nr:hypothetical protein N0V93_004473 [Gnomoniopsis smithogilvyi]